MSLVLKYFPELSPTQITQFEKLQALYEDWNSKINVISRKDMEHFEERHLLHSLGIAKIIQFKSGTKILDVGTGGGFPGIPLAILFPDSTFLLVDSIGKKIKVVQEVATALKLKNVIARQQRAEEVKEKFHFVVSRAVTEFPVFHKWVKHKFLAENNHEIKNGILYLKGGDLKDEFGPMLQHAVLHDLKDYFSEEFFESKKVVYFKA
ncbi:MAG: 16S rRNA (guanine(527)-N(7))-methyltransferase RsmG [Sphingobacteriaceae bacterium]|nr:16S rRNA (guanine(527)-N(7))-methyltransferase RsmG [Sphingobacteriaceae bacterium]